MMDDVSVDRNSLMSDEDAPHEITIDVKERCYTVFQGHSLYEQIPEWNNGRIVGATKGKGLARLS